jgi:hypothetical protein
VLVGLAEAVVVDGPGAAAVVVGCELELSPPHPAATTPRLASAIKKRCVLPMRSPSVRWT